jgi:hypothetical protein
MRIILSALALTITFSAAAMASENEGNNTCGQTNQSEWIGQEAAKAKAVALGLDVRQVKEEGGCYEIYAIDKNGKKSEKLMHPVTGEFVGSENEG